MGMQNLLWTMDECFLLRWELHNKSRASSLAGLWKNKAFLDVTIVCDDDQIDAHKLILSAASPLFQRILLRNENHVGRPLLYLRGTRKKQIQNLLEFIYKGEVSVNPENLESFIELANNLEIEGLVGNLNDDCGKTNQMDLTSVISENRENEHIKNSVISHEGSSFGRNSTTLASTEETFSNSVVIPKNDLDYSMDKYDEIVQNLILTSDNGGTREYSCKECPYKKTRKTHVMEHVGKHINGFVFTCNICEKTYRSKVSLR